jgi:hypothetical protein
MSLEHIDKNRVQGARRELILVYGIGGEGKTRFVTSLTPRFGEMIYIAIDEGSENLDSVLAKYRHRIHVYRPEWKNPLVDAGEIASTNWKLKHPEAKTIIIDTFSTWAWIVLQYITNHGMFSTKRVVIGEGTILQTALPDKGEFGGVHAQIRNFLTQLFNNQRDMNVIMVCHSDPPEPGRGAGGPSTVGKKMTEWLPARFKTVIRLDREVQNTVQGGTIMPVSKFVARSAPHGEWIARINEASERGNPLPYVVLNVDPVNYWETYDAAVLPKKEEQNV